MITPRKVENPQTTQWLASVGFLHHNILSSSFFFWKYQNSLTSFFNLSPVFADTHILNSFKWVLPINFYQILTNANNTTAKSNLDVQIRPMCPSYSKETGLNINFKHHVMRYFVSTLGKYWKNFKTGRKLRFQPSKIQTAPKIGT